MEVLPQGLNFHQVELKVFKFRVFIQENRSKFIKLCNRDIFVIQVVLPVVTYYKFSF